MGKLVISLTYKKEPCSLRNRALFYSLVGLCGGVGLGGGRASGSRSVLQGPGGGIGGILDHLADDQITVVVVAVLAHRQDQHPVAGHRLIGLVQIGGAVRLLPQLVEEAVEHVSVGKVVVVNDVAGIILHAAHDLIGHAAILLIHIHQMLLAEIQILQHALQAAEHGAVGLIVAVQHGDRIVQITAVDGLALAGSLAENGAGLVAVAVQITAEVCLLYTSDAADE